MAKRTKTRLERLEDVNATASEYETMITTISSSSGLPSATVHGYYAAVGGQPWVFNPPSTGMISHEPYYYGPSICVLHEVAVLEGQPDGRFLGRCGLCGVSVAFDAKPNLVAFVTGLVEEALALAHTTPLRSAVVEKFLTARDLIDTLQDDLHDVQLLMRILGALLAGEALTLDDSGLCEAESEHHTA